MLSHGSAVPLAVALVGALATGCVSFAVPPPAFTFGGPATAARRESQFGFGAGSGASLFPGAHSGGTGWFGRWRIGLSDRLETGVDVFGMARGDKGTFTGKLAGKLQLRPLLAFEIGLGAADDSDGKSLGADLGAIVGGQAGRSAWAPYGALRVSGGLAVTERRDDEGNVLTPPHALLVLGSVGAAVRLCDFARFVIEGGYGGIFVNGHEDAGQALYVGVGLLVTARPPR
jgi:hypothetical protein